MKFNSFEEKKSPRSNWIRVRGDERFDGDRLRGFDLRPNTYTYLDM